MRCLLPSFLLLFALGCTSDYKLLQSIPLDQNCLSKIQPMGFETSWYTARADMGGEHISGLLFIKSMPDSSTRVVFTNETGITFLDFEFSRMGQFNAHHVIRQLNKKPVITTLRRDFELMLGIPFRKGSLQAWEMNHEILFGVRQKNETAYFISGTDCASLQRMESGTKRRKKSSVFLYGKQLQAPDSVRINHHTFKMQINLVKLIKD